MRAVLVGLSSPVPFDHLLHSHSHTLYFGWAALGLLIVGLSMLASPETLHTVAVVLAALTPAIFLGFLATGYHPVTIAISTVTMLAWYVAIWRWVSAAKTATGAGPALFKAGLIYLIIASLGVWALAALQASGAGTPLSETLAVHAFLLGFAWFLVLCVVGGLVTMASKFGLVFDEHRVLLAKRWWVALAWLTFPLGVVGGPEVPLLGPAARAAGLLLLYPAGIWLRELWRASQASPARAVWRTAGTWFAVTTLTTTAAALGGSGALIVSGRQGVIIHLHALLVGFVTTPLILMLRPDCDHTPIHAHTAALTAMIAGLSLAMFGLVNVGMWLALVAAVGLWVAGGWWAWVIGRS